MMGDREKYKALWADMPQAQKNIVLSTILPIYSEILNSGFEEFENFCLEGINASDDYCEYWLSKSEEMRKRYFAYISGDKI